ncbi:MAG: hypothetical protein SFW35_05490 [Chitinophagales bacterium]|nr:hypothetical protein [Chitinophagales bacterium]
MVCLACSALVICPGQPSLWQDEKLIATKPNTAANAKGFLTKFLNFMAILGFVVINNVLSIPIFMPNQNSGKNNTNKQIHAWSI